MTSCYPFNIETDANPSSSSRPICDTTEHACHAPPGKVLIDSIKVYTASCDGCSAAAEGVKVELVGETNGASPTGVVCNSNTMDHAGSTDFGSGSAEFNGRINGQEDQAEKNMMGGCYEVRVLSLKQSATGNHNHRVH